MVVQDGEKIEITGVYSRLKPKKGFKGYWESTYVFLDIADKQGNILADTYTFGALKSIKGQHFKEGDIISMEVTVKVKPRGGYKFMYPKNVQKLSVSEDDD